MANHGLIYRKKTGERFEGEMCGQINDATKCRKCPLYLERKFYPIGSTDSLPTWSTAELAFLLLKVPFPATGMKRGFAKVSI